MAWEVDFDFGWGGDCVEFDGTGIKKIVLKYIYPFYNIKPHPKDLSKSSAVAGGFVYRHLECGGL